MHYNIIPTKYWGNDYKYKLLTLIFITRSIFYYERNNNTTSALQNKTI